MNSGSDIYLQSIYDAKMTISVDTGRKGKPFFLGRGI
jgi:hypothetical protein